jgi:hypothetical protein
VEDGSVDVMIVAGAFPWRQMERKLARKAVVVSLSAWPDARAEYVIPAPVYLESVEDVPAPFDARTETFSLAAQLLQPPAGVIAPADFLARIEPSIGRPGDALAARLAAVYKTRRGSVISYKDGSSTPLDGFKSAEDLRQALLAGAVWVDRQVSEAPLPRFCFAGNGRPVSPAAGYGWRGVHGLSVSPVLSKLYQESGLRNAQEA